MSDMTPSVSIDSLPPAVQRSVSPNSPVPVRMMAAKGLIPCGPRDLLTAIYLLSHDPDPKVAQTARESAASLSDRILSSGLRDDELAPGVLDLFARMQASNDAYLELIALNPATSDDTIAQLASVASEGVVEVIAQNQLRLLRDERVVIGLVKNPQTRSSTRDRILDFCVRSGVALDELPEFVEAKRRLLGEDPSFVTELAQAELNKADDVLSDYGDALQDETASLDESERLTFSQRVAQMSVSEKIKLATRGNKEARTILLRDSNKLVALATVQSPKITESEILSLSNNRTVHDDVMRYITSNREWMKLYQVKVNLVNNPKCPAGTGLRLLPHIRTNELKGIARNKNISSTIQLMAKQMLAKKIR